MDEKTLQKEQPVPSGNFDIIMENHNFQWVYIHYKWSDSIAMLVNTRWYTELLRSTGAKHETSQALFP